MSRAAVILAAGKGTRMKSDLPKVLHQIDDAPMVCHVLDAVAAAGIARRIVVVGYEGQSVVDACADSGAEIVWQHEQLGTGHAVQQAEEALSGFSGTVVVLNGDVPGLRARTLEGFLGRHEASGAAATVMSARVPDPTGYGRIVRGADGSLQRIVEHKDATQSQRDIDEINSGLFCFDATSLFAALRQTDRSNSQNEFYLTDVIEKLSAAARPVAAHCVDDYREVGGVNTVEELEAARQFMVEMGR